MPLAIPLILLLSACRSDECACEEQGTTWHPDLDADGWGADEGTVVSCAWPAGTVPWGGDCDDADPTVHPNAWDDCDGVDDDCDGATDEDAATATRWTDADGDGWGDDDAPLETCDPALGADRAGDCDDADPDVFPGALESCDDTDEDCDGEVDEVEPYAWLDADGDGYGDDASRATACDWPDGPPEGWVDVGGDCDDADPTVRPGAEDPLGDGIDGDCDGFADDLPLALADRAWPGWWNGEASGTALAAGDLNGDHVDDLLVGAPLQATGGLRGGSAYVLLGEPGGPSSADPHLFHADLRLWGPAEAGAGEALVAIPDLDGDGAAELAVGAPGLSTVWLVPGSGTWTPGGGPDATGSLCDLGAAWLGDEDGAGAALAVTGDVRGDGPPDLLVGAPDGSRAYLLDGAEGLTRSGGTLSGVALSIEGDDDEAGAAVASADLDGDGLADLAVGAPGHDTPLADAGRVGLWLSPGTGRIDLDDADALWIGTQAGDRAGATLAATGDLDGDGLDDLAIGAPGAGGGAGLVALVERPAEAGGDLARARARLPGEASGDGTGPVASAGDANGDGPPDLLVAAPCAGGGAGAVWLLFGPFEGEVPLAWAAEKWFGEDGGLGAGLAAADLDGDGSLDVAIAAPGASDLYAAAGTTWLFLGPW